MKAKHIFVIFAIHIIIAILLFGCKKDEETEDFSGTSGTFNDERDNQTYSWIKIGDQIWMGENLNYETDNGSWVYDNNSSNASTYGRLYDWETTCDVCPDGWHLPSDDEWKILEMYLGMNQSEANSINWRGTNEGSKLKSTSGWNSGGNGTNESGFSALPGGDRNFFGVFQYMGNSAWFWSSTEDDSDIVWARILKYNVGGVSRDNFYKECGFSVRCIKD